MPSVPESTAYTVFSDGCNGTFIGQMIVLLDEDGAKGNPGRNRRSASFRLEGLHVNLLNVFPGHDGSQPHPTVRLQQLPAKGHKEILNGNLVSIG